MTQRGPSPISIGDWDAIDTHKYRDEAEAVRALLERIPLSPAAVSRFAGRILAPSFQPMGGR
jgi:hypothetical protein